MKQIILGTAGHIDHGKTSLIRALTGINTDRLKEEQQRGITIELGFAHVNLPSGERLGIVDVPGHEKFVKNMVAGATGIDIVAMVIAADEGVMPQTREHMEICTLLGIQYGLVVLTKIDLVDEEWMELVTEDVREFTQGTFLEDAPIIPVSSADGRGIDDFLSALDELGKKVPERKSTGLFRLPVDRVFTMKGFGTVITGTLISGRISVGDTVMIYPSRVTSKVRGIQVHNESVEQALSGMRTAINFQGLEKAAINRGDVVSTPNDLIASYMLDVSFHYLAGNKKNLKNRTQVRFHSGTAEILGNVILLDREELEPGDTAIAQLRLDTPVALVRDDRFVIRSYSPVRTIGGGYVINPIPVKHKRFRKDVIQGLEALLTQDPEAIVTQHILGAGFRGVGFAELKIMTNIPEKPLNNLLQSLLSKRQVIQTDKENRVYIHHDHFEQLIKLMVDHLTAYHKANPLKPGMLKEELKSKFPPYMGAKLFTLVLGQMVKDQVAVQEDKIVRLASHEVALGMDQEELKNNILTTYQDSGLQPPYFKDVIGNLKVAPDRAKDVLMLLIDQGHIVKVKEELYFSSQSIDQLKAKLVAYLKENGEIDMPRFKAMTNLSRKYLIPLMEYFDSQNVTIRVGDVRKLRSG